jgi:hypothetical protein
VPAPWKSQAPPGAEFCSRAVAAQRQPEARRAWMQPENPAPQVLCSGRFRIWCKNEFQAEARSHTKNMPLPSGGPLQARVQLPAVLCSRVEVGRQQPVAAVPESAPSQSPALWPRQRQERAAAPRSSAGVAQQPPAVAPAWLFWELPAPPAACSGRRRTWCKNEYPPEAPVRRKDMPAAWGEQPQGRLRQPEAQQQLAVARAAAPWASAALLPACSGRRRT